jgi:predicted DNA repair protein MutK
MASSLLALVDDIATLLDDVSLLTKVAAQKTAGVLGDDLALNAQQVSGVAAERELPVVWAVAKGSLVNKAILVPAALAISAIAGWAVTALLMVGGAFLCFEAFEKVAHRFSARGREEDRERCRELAQALADEKIDVQQLERDKIRGAIRTDFILSAEIITIALGTVADQDFMTRLAVLAAIAVVMTVGVYGIVAGIVKLDDAGAWLQKRGGAVSGAIGRGLVIGAPTLMRFLSFAGTAAMFLVGGNILTHGIEPLHHATQAFAESMPGGLQLLTGSLLHILTGMVAGAVVLAVVSLARRLVPQRQPAA